MKVAIIGAGIAGLACARRLEAQGGKVTLFDKGRGPGGRMSTRRAQTPLGEARFDHGAQFFTASDPGFVAVVDALMETDHVAEWPGEFVDFGPHGEADKAPDKRRYVGQPGMNAVIRALGDGLDVRFGSRVETLSRENGHWSVATEGGDTSELFDTLVVATPAEQAAPLLSPVHRAFSEKAAAIESLPNWTLMLAFENALPLPWNGAKFSDGPIGWAARNSSKPGRGTIETWLIQANAAWSAQYLERDNEDVAHELTESFLNRFADQLGKRPIPVFRSAHRWRYAFVPEREKVNGFDWDAGLRLGVCGDWQLGPRVEMAWLSGDLLGAEIG